MNSNETLLVMLGEGCAGHWTKARQAKAAILVVVWLKQAFTIRQACDEATTLVKEPEEV